MNAFLERTLMKALSGDRDDAQRKAAARLLAHANAGLYEMDQRLTREEAHDRRV